ncbi:MAG: hypothetical protein RLZZ600_1148 [Actinomycetota bacterium]
MTPPANATTSRWNVSSILWTIVLAIMSGFQLWRGAYVDGVLFTAITLLLVIDSSTGGRFRIFRKHFVAPRWVTVSIVLAIGLVLVIAPRHGLVDLVATVLIGVAAFILGWAPASARQELPARAYRASSITWSILAVALCLWEALAFIFSTYLPGGEENYPTISVLLDPFLNWMPGKVIFIGLWLAAGLALLRVWGTNRGKP